MKEILKYRKAFALVLLVMLTSRSWAQGELSSTSIQFYIVIGFVFITALIVVAILTIILKLLKIMVKDQAKRQAELRGEVYVEEVNKDWWSRFLTKANDAVPVEQEARILLDHDYDGIKELDNHLPPWWKYLFYMTIVFSIGYLGVYHVFDTMPLQTEEYENEVALAEMNARSRKADTPASNINEDNVQQVTDEAALANGKEVFIGNCAACHKESGAGGIGPNLTDPYWLHGGDVKSIFKTIKYGVPEKGMISWEPLLSPDEMQNVTSYVLSIVGTNPDNPKAPQGELYEPVTTDTEPGDPETDTLTSDSVDSMAVEPQQ